MSKKNKKTQNNIDNLYATKSDSQQQSGLMDAQANNQDSPILDASSPAVGIDLAADGAESETVTSEENTLREDDTFLSYVGDQYYSQCQEDKYLSDYFNEFKIRIPETIVEIGAGRPEEISNSRYWIKNGFDALLIEPNHALYTELTSFYDGNGKVQVNQLMIGEEAGVGELAVSKKHWALSMASEDLESQEGHEMQVVGIEPLTGALNFWSKWPCEIGIISIDTEGREMLILNQMLDNEIYPAVILVESQTEADTKTQVKLLEEKYVHIATLSLTNVFIRKDVKK